MIQELHGNVKDLVICKNTFSEENEMNDELKTLEDYGVIGTSKNSTNDIIVPLVYNFKPIDHDEPLLLIDGSYNEIIHSIK